MRQCRPHRLVSFVCKQLYLHFSLLDIISEVHYILPMEERSVRYNEQEQMHAPAAETNLPAPMVERAFRLLDLLSVTEEGLTLSELARSLHMSKSSLHGLLKTLEKTQAIEQIEERRFILGPHIYDLAQSYIQRAGLRQFALPAMQRLASSTGETVCLGRVEAKGVRIIECTVDEGEQIGLHIAVRRGMRLPLLAGATGLCVLATWPLAQREHYLRTHPLPHFTDQSITDPVLFLAKVEEVARSGRCIDHGAYLLGVNAVAVPIFSAGQTLAALLWVVGFASRFQGESLERAAEHLCVEARTISLALGASS